MPTEVKVRLPVVECRKIKKKCGDDDEAKKNGSGSKLERGCKKVNKTRCKLVPRRMPLEVPKAKKTCWEVPRQVCRRRLTGVAKQVPRWESKLAGKSHLLSLTSSSLSPIRYKWDTICREEEDMMEVGDEDKGDEEEEEEHWDWSFEREEDEYKD